MAHSGFVARERQGHWSAAIVPAGIPAPGMYYLGPTGAAFNAVACPPGVDLCVAGGYYYGSLGAQQGFVVSQSR